MHLAGFKAALADNLYGSSIAAASTVETYCNQVCWILQQHQTHKLSKAVSRGIAKELQDGRRYQGSLDLSFFATLYSMVFNPAAEYQDLKFVRNLLVHGPTGHNT